MRVEIGELGVNDNEEKKNSLTSSCYCILLFGSHNFTLFTRAVDPLPFWYTNKFLCINKHYQRCRGAVQAFVKS